MLGRFTKMFTSIHHGHGGGTQLYSQKIFRPFSHLSVSSKKFHQTPPIPDSKPFPILYLYLKSLICTLIINAKMNILMESFYLYFKTILTNIIPSLAYITIIILNTLSNMTIVQDYFTNSLLIVWIYK